MAYPRKMTEEDILKEVNWILNPEKAIMYGPSSMTCHYDFWALFIQKLVKERKELEDERKELEDEVESLERRLDCFEV